MKLIALTIAAGLILLSAQTVLAQESSRPSAEYLRQACQHHRCVESRSAISSAAEERSCSGIGRMAVPSSLASDPAALQFHSYCGGSVLLARGRKSMAQPVRIAMISHASLMASTLAAVWISGSSTAVALASKAPVCPATICAGAPMNAAASASPL